MATRRLGIAIMIAALPLPALAIGSCALSGFSRETSPTAADAGADVVSDASDFGDAGDAGDGNMGCAHTTYPDPPQGTQLGGAIEFVAAIRSIDMGETSPPIGLDLDGLCSCEGEGQSCKTSKQICDGPGGIDNQAQSLFSLFGKLASSFGSTYFSKSAEAGAWSLLMRVKGYNGMPDDDNVELDWYITTSFNAETDGGVAPPKWDGEDEWPVSTASLAQPANSIDMPIYADTNAYVSGGVVVASLPDAQIVFSGGVSRAIIQVTAGFVVAKVEQVAVTGGDAGMRWALRDGLIVGRWKTKDVFATLSSYRDDNGQPFCSNTFAYLPAKQQFCSAVDISSTVSTPTTPCDSISLGIGFQSFPAQLGVLTVPAAVSNACPDGGDPGTDSCSTP